MLAWLESRKRPPYALLSHGEDLDGLVSASIFLRVMGGFVKTKFTTPYSARKSPRRFDVVMDLPPPRGGCLLTIDHHRSNIHLARERSEKAIVKPDYPSTALLAWELFREEADLDPLKHLVDLTSRVDSGQYDQGSVRFTAGVKSIFSSGKRDNGLRKVVVELLEALPSSGEELTLLKSVKPFWKEIEETEVERLTWISSLPAQVSDGRDTAVLVRLGRAPGYLTPFVHYNLQSLVDLEATIRRSDNDKVKLSIRSREGSRITALELASKMGGGGHERAAGASISERDVESFVKLLERAGMRVVVAVHQ